MDDLMRAGPITGIVRLEKTRFPDLDPVTFGTIDGDRYHQVQNEAALGDELELWEEGSNTMPIACALRWVLQQAAGYMTADMSGVTREGVAHPHQVVARKAREKEEAFQEEHGMSSAEYFHESGYSDADDERAFLERAAEEAAQEDEDEYGEAQAELEEEEL